MELRPGSSALVRSRQRTATVSLLTLDESVAPGDWVVCHSGFALGRVTPEEAAEATEIRSPAAASAMAPTPAATPTPMATATPTPHRHRP
ncbi:MAG TPA: HypC/HybG/HupF family hydrogenase formation chaperone [Ornithinibacter sp.]|nr:HypC/HybG/HupF family hydrogenase formation chaperone [Ornithinibacter sp.]